MGEADVRVAVGRVLAALREAGRSEGTIRRHQVVLDRFAASLAGRGLITACDQVCVDFIASQTGTRLGALREPVRGRAVKAARRAGGGPTPAWRARRAAAARALPPRV